MMFSILIANYNNGKFFKDCYHSIISQTYKDWEVIVVDDQSTDDSLPIIQELIKDDNRFKLFVNEENEGCGFTKNKCADLANGQVCGFLDPDDALMPEALQLMVTAHGLHLNASLVHSTFYYCDEYLNVQSIYKIPGEVKVNERFTNFEGRVNHFSTYKNEYYKKTEGISKSLLRAVDQDLYLKLSEVGEFYYLDKPLYKYRIHTNGIATANTDKALFWFLKGIANAEERRKINLENEVALYLNRTDPGNIEKNNSNPRYLILAFLKAFKNSPGNFFKKLFLNK